MAKRSNAAQQKRSLRQRQTEARRAPRQPSSRAVDGELLTVTDFRLQHSEASGLSDAGRVEDSEGLISKPAGRINDTLRRLKTKGSLDDASYAAGLHLQDLAGLARLEPIGSAPLERVNCPYSEGLLTDAMLQARRDLDEAIGHIGRGTLQALACWRCVCEGRTIGGFLELERQPDGSRFNPMLVSGLIVAGLGRLAIELYGDRSTNGNRPMMQALHGNDIAAFMARGR